MDIHQSAFPLPNWYGRPVNEFGPTRLDLIRNLRPGEKRVFEAYQPDLHDGFFNWRESRREYEFWQLLIDSLNDGHDRNIFFVMEWSDKIVRGEQDVPRFYRHSRMSVTNAKGKPSTP